MKDLEKLRKEIDTLDNEIVSLLEKRFLLTNQMFWHKKGLTDAKRESAILEKIDSIYIKNIYRAIFQNSKESMKTTLPHAL